MSYWKDEYNYRRIKDKNGKVIKNVIIIDGKQIEVSNEVYEAYSQMHRREVYQEQQIREARLISLDYLIECDVSIDKYVSEQTPSAESTVLNAMTNHEKKFMLYRLYKTLGELATDEKKLIVMLYFKKKTEREAAEHFQVSQPAIHKRKLKILQKLKKLLET